MPESHRSKRSQRARAQPRAGSFVKKEDALVLTKSGKEDVRSVKDKMELNIEQEHHAFKKYSKQSRDPRLTDKQQAKIAHIAAEEAGHRVEIHKIIEEQEAGKTGDKK